MVTKNDLPVMANTADIQVKHFILDLNCNFSQQTLDGSIVLFLDNSPNCTNQQVFSVDDFYTKHNYYEQNSHLQPQHLINQQRHDLQPQEHNHPSEHAPLFELILDCVDLVITSVEELAICGDVLHTMHRHIAGIDACHLQCRHVEGKALGWSSDEWCLRVWKGGVETASAFPRVVRVCYKTSTTGKSLRWATDQDGRSCVYSAAMLINNRALMPCQEFGALCTWQAFVRVPIGAVVLMSSDVISHHRESGQTEYYHCCTVPLPSFTLAIAIGFWDSIDLSSDTDECNHHKPNFAPFNCHLFAPSSLVSRAGSEFGTYLRKSWYAVQCILGVSPFSTLNILIYPSCSQDMALANPSLLFVSQSLLAADGSLCYRLSHELTHFWFGLMIGARDWTEEWLSEGFATYMEDVVHGQVMSWSSIEQSNYSELKALVRLRILKAELENTSDDLQMLRPNRGEEAVSSKSVMFVKNGLNTDKLFTQVHYLKGYFLLHHLAKQVGNVKFNTMLKQYVAHFSGQMVTSKDFLIYAFNTLPKLGETTTIDDIYTDWLDCAGLPELLRTYECNTRNVLYQEVVCQANKWKIMNMRIRKYNRKRIKLEVDTLKKMHSVQMVLLLENLLEHPRLSFALLRQIAELYRLPTEANAEVYHCWCELVVKHKYVAAYKDVADFLLNHQAMGVYLYGELILSGCSKATKLAKDCFHQISATMESSTCQIVHAMLYGDEVI